MVCVCDMFMRKWGFGVIYDTFDRGKVCVRISDDYIGSTFFMLVSREVV